MVAGEHEGDDAERDTHHRDDDQRAEMTVVSDRREGEAREDQHERGCARVGKGAVYVALHTVQAHPEVALLAERAPTPAEEGAEDEAVGGGEEGKRGGDPVAVGVSHRCGQLGPGVMSSSKRVISRARRRRPEALGLTHWRDAGRRT